MFRPKYTSALRKITQLSQYTQLVISLRIIDNIYTLCWDIKKLAKLNKDLPDWQLVKIITMRWARLSIPEHARVLLSFETISRKRRSAVIGIAQKLFLIYLSMHTRTNIIIIIYCRHTTWKKRRNIPEPSHISRRTREVTCYIRGSYA